MIEAEAGAKPRPHFAAAVLAILGIGALVLARLGVDGFGILIFLVEDLHRQALGITVLAVAKRVEGGRRR